MSTLVFSMPHSAPLGAAIAQRLGAEIGQLTLRRFPDGEAFVRVESDVAERDVIIACGLDRPDDKLMPLYLLASTLREMGATRLMLATPYLPYMRQDRAFHPGEAVSARHFAAWLSGVVDGLVTMDPHLHRIHALDEVYSVPSRVVAAAPAVADWIRANVDRPLLVGPDEESRQWVEDVAGRAGAPHTVLTKTRRGDRDVEVSVPEVERWGDRTPVLVDDIISTARTMIATIGHLRDAGLAPPVCVGVHAIFAGDAYTALQAATPGDIVTCNSVAHPSNRIDVAPLIADGVADLLAAG